MQAIQDHPAIETVQRRLVMRPVYIKPQDILPGDTIVWRTAANGGKLTYVIVSAIEEYEDDDMATIKVRGEFSDVAKPAKGSWMFRVNGATDILLVDRKQGN